MATWSHSAELRQVDICLLWDPLFLIRLEKLSFGRTLRQGGLSFALLARHGQRAEKTRLQDAYVGQRGIGSEWAPARLVNINPSRLDVNWYINGRTFTVLLMLYNGTNEVRKFVRLSLEARWELLRE